MVRIRNLDTNNVREVKTIDVKQLNDLKEQRDQYKTERDTLIDDLKVLREKNEELEEEMKRLKRESNITVFCALMEENSELNKENEKLMVESKQYTTLTDHIRLKASANPGEHRYIALVNFVDRLEKGES